MPARNVEPARASAFRVQAPTSPVAERSLFAPEERRPADRVYGVSVLTSFEEWVRFADSWNGLLAQSRAETVFLTWQWVYTWAECYWRPGSELFILAVYRGNELVGIAPWCIRRCPTAAGTVRKVAFLGGSDVASEYLDVFAKRGKEREVARCVFDFLFTDARARWDTLELAGIPADSLFLLHFLANIDEKGKHVEIDAGVFCPTMPLPSTSAALFENLSANRREQFRRHLRLLQRSRVVEHSTITTHEGIRAGTLEILAALYKWKSGPEQVRLRRFLEGFLRRIEGTNWGQIDLLAIDGKPVAAFLHLRFGGTLSLYLVATDKAAYTGVSVGNVLIGLSLEKAVADGLSEYDFLRGSESYKFHWATGGRRSLTVRLHQRRAPVLLHMGFSCLKALAKVASR
jgi:CelD/BcsL family acetyltransferase involved in cellulose biosynthesis